MSSEVGRFNSWREEAGLDATDALGSGLDLEHDKEDVSPAPIRSSSTPAATTTTGQENIPVTLSTALASKDGQEEEEEEVQIERTKTSLPEREDSQSLAEGLDAADAEGLEEYEIEGGGSMDFAEERIQTSEHLAMPSQQRLKGSSSSDSAYFRHSPSSSSGEDEYPVVGSFRVPLPVTPHRTEEDEYIDSDDDGEEEHKRNVSIPPTGLLESQRSAMPQTKQSRFILRDSAFAQASIKINVKNRLSKRNRTYFWELMYLFYTDWFDIFLTFKTWKILAYVWIFYTWQLLLFALFYLAASTNCDSTQEMTFQESFAFSLEIATTVGYTLPQSNEAMFFNGCGSWIVLVFIQTIICMVLNGIILGIIMLRFSRADRRAIQVIFSDKACISCIQGRFYFTFQCFDMQSRNSLIGAKVRVFAVFHELKPNQPGALWQTRTMRLTRPDDELGANLWLSVPCVVFHEIDCWSPLAPSIISNPPPVPFGSAVNRFPHVPQRASNGRQGMRSQSVCVICGSTFLTDSALRRHIAYSARREKANNLPGRHGALDTRKISRPVVTRTTVLQQQEDASASTSAAAFETVTPESVRDAISERFRRRNIEVVILVEGTDAITANSFQARHSYCSQDIEYDSQHSPCLGIGKDGVAEVNLSNFHKTWKGETNFEEAIAYPTFT